MNRICEKEKCTACFACINICPKHCISMHIDDDLCFRPVIDPSLCIGCKKCENVCPNNNMPAFSGPQNVFAGYSKNEAHNKSAASGGIAGTLSRLFMEKQGIVYGAAIGEDLSVKHIRCTNHNDTKRLQGSKYVHSHIGECYQWAQKDLQEGKNVLFIATACQIAGLLNYLGRDYANLFTVDVICHGTPDKTVFEAYTKFVLGEEYKNLQYFSFRNGNDYVLRYFDRDNHPLLKLKARESLYLNHFLDGLNMRPNCYTCEYAKIERISDLTLGDFWGLEQGKSPYGTNLILVNTKKGADLLFEIENDVHLTKSTIESALKSNDQLSAPVRKSESAKAFQALCKTTQDANTALKKCDKKKAFLIRVRHFLYAHKRLYTILKKVPYIREKIY